MNNFNIVSQEGLDRIRYALKQSLHYSLSGNMTEKLMVGIELKKIVAQEIGPHTVSSSFNANNETVNVCFQSNEADQNGIFTRAEFTI